MRFLVSDQIRTQACQITHVHVVNHKPPTFHPGHPISLDLEYRGCSRCFRCEQAEAKHTVTCGHAMWVSLWGQKETHRFVVIRAWHLSCSSICHQRLRLWGHCWISFPHTLSLQPTVAASTWPTSGPLPLTLVAKGAGRR